MISRLTDASKNAITLALTYTDEQQQLINAIDGDLSLFTTFTGISKQLESIPEFLHGKFGSVHIGIFSPTFTITKYLVELNDE